MEFREFKEKLFNRAKNEGFQECEIYFVNRESLNITVYEEEVEKYNLNKTFKASARFFRISTKLLGYLLEEKFKRKWDIHTQKLWMKKQLKC